MTPRNWLPLLLVPIASGLGAQTPSITIDPVACLPTEANAPMVARISPQPPAEDSVRLYFRRLNLEVEDFYYIEMEPIGGGQFWGVFPQPEDATFPKKNLAGRYRDPRPNTPADDPNPEGDRWAKWWRTKEGSETRDPNEDLDDDLIKERAALGKLERRSWMQRLQDSDFQRWLERQKTEPAEYYVAVHDPAGAQVSRSEMQVAEVKDDCKTTLNPQQQGWAKNLTIGETARWQKGKPVFHWDCDGIVTRLDPSNILRADEACRACVVGWWPIAGATGGALTIVTLPDGNPDEVSPSRP